MGNSYLHSDGAAVLVHSFSDHLVGLGLTGVRHLGSKRRHSACPVGRYASCNNQSNAALGSGFHEGGHVAQVGTLLKTCVLWKRSVGAHRVQAGELNTTSAEHDDCQQRLTMEPINTRLRSVCPELSGNGDSKCLNAAEAALLADAMVLVLVLRAARCV